ncbi:MAG: DNA topoisomerase VI subunit B [Candidatus Korarchaeota archaeon]
MSEKVVTKTASEFFADNKQIAGFDNPARSLFTSIRELVENGLDAAEAAGVLPEICVIVRPLETSEILKMLGIKSKEEEWILSVKSKLGNSCSEGEESGGFDQPIFYEVICIDNGTGISHENIPSVFGIVLTGTKYGIRQHRGRFGLGAKMALIYAQETSGYPLEVFSKTNSEKFVSHYQIELDIHKNTPRIKLEEKILTNKFQKTYPLYSKIIPHGTVVKLVMGGDWIRSKRFIMEYFRQIAIITPYATFHVELPGEKLDFPRSVEVMPPIPKPVLPHPSGVGLQQLKSIRDAVISENVTVLNFLTNNFQRVGEKSAKEFLETVNIDPRKRISELTEEEMLRIAYQFKHFKFMPPDASALSPLGPELLKQSMIKIMRCEFVETVQRPPVSYEGHPMIVEVGMGYGGEIPQGITLFRFANRIPLLYGAGNDVSTKVIEEINWARYKLDKKNDPLLIAVSVVSTKIPFPETSKEYISDVDVLHREIKLAITECARKLSLVIVRKRKVEQEKKKVNIIMKYAEQTIRSASNVLANLNRQKYSYEVLIEKAKELIYQERKLEELEKKVEESMVKEEPTQVAQPQEEGMKIPASSSKEAEVNVTIQTEVAPSQKAVKTKSTEVKTMEERKMKEKKETGETIETEKIKSAKPTPKKEVKKTVETKMEVAEKIKSVTKSTPGKATGKTTEKIKSATRPAPKKEVKKEREVKKSSEKDSKKRTLKEKQSKPLQHSKKPTGVKTGKTETEEIKISEDKKSKKVVTKSESKTAAAKTSGPVSTEATRASGTTETDVKKETIGDKTTQERTQLTLDDLSKKEKNK